MASFHPTRRFGLIILTMLSFFFRTSAQPQIRITNTGRIEQVNMGNAVYIGLNAGLSNSPSSTNNVFVGGQCGADNSTGFTLTAVGVNALRLNTTGHANCAFGYSALEYNHTGDRNVGIGANAMENSNSGDDNVAVGYSALSYNTSGLSNVAVGNYALQNSNGNSNTAIGFSALQQNLTGIGNVAVGKDALLNSSTSGGNVAVGMSALRYIQGGNNVGLGSGAGVNDSLSLQNVFIGSNAGSTAGIVVSRSNNVMLGYDAGRGSMGNGNVFLGPYAGKNANVSNKLYIDNVETTTPLIYGDFTANKLEFNGLTELKAAQNFPALIWDAGGGVLKNNTDALLWDRPIFKILLDADNNNSGSSGEARFQLFSNVDTSAALTAKVSLNCDGGDSWINSGDVGIGVTNPAYKMDVAGVINASSGLVGPNAALRAQGAEAVWFDGTQFSWGFGGTWNRFADSVRIGTNVSPSHMLQVDGIARSSQSTWATTSDVRVKENIVTIENALATIGRFRPVTFDWIASYKNEHPEVKDGNYGFISQEVEKIIPSMVTVVKEKIGDQTIEDFRVLNADALVPLLVRAVQEQQTIIDSQQEQIDHLQKQYTDMVIVLQDLQSSRRAQHVEAKR